MSKSGMPELPGTDRSDPKVMSGARGAAARYNNQQEKKYPLFAVAGLVERRTAEDVIRRREAYQEGCAQFMRELRAMDMRHLRGYKREILEIAGAAEFRRICRRVVTAPFPKDRLNRWRVAHMKIKRRRETEFTDHMDLVLAWLLAWEGEPPTARELHRACGDGLMTEGELEQAIQSLNSLDLVTICVGRPCRVSNIPFCATWKATNKPQE